MIRKLRAGDVDSVIHIVNENWKHQYNGYVNPSLLNEQGCYERSESLKQSFFSGLLQEYVWEENGEVLALLSIGQTEDEDKPRSFEIWRVYVSPGEQGRGIGKRLLDFGEQKARESRYREIVIWAFQENRRAIEFYQKNGYIIDNIIYLGEPYQAWGTRLVKQI